ncbi:MAG: hypothetical protein J3Q66DRAFT_178277 [Benniella sp.]|nr:MAG: hypothetical protein J3Q66DRAFT_178277 [Benniella sp.]
MYLSEPTIDDHLYDQYFQQHQDLLRFGDAGPYGSPDETLGGTYNPGFFSTTPGAQSFPPLNSDFEPETMWNTPFPDKMSQADSGMLHGHVPSLDRDMENLAYRHEKLSMLGISPQPISFSPASSSSSSLQQFHEMAESSPLAAKPISSERATESEMVTKTTTNTTTTMSDPSVSESDESAAAHVASPQDASKFLSYSDIVKAPVKPPTTLQGKENLPHQDMKRRGNTNKSLDEKEYRLNLFLKNLEPNMDEYKLYDICVQFGPVMSCRTITMNHGVCTGLGFVMYINNECVDRAIEGLGKLGIHAEVAVQSATNKLRCKTLSDMLFIQNIPPHIKENKVQYDKGGKEGGRTICPDALCPML